MNRTFTSLFGANLQYKDSGNPDKTPLIFIHGFPLRQEMWDKQVEAFKEEYRVITYDQRGFGSSDTLDGQYTFEIYVDDLINLMDHLKISKAVIVGFSMGGYVALRAIERAPERFSGMVLANTQSSSDSDEAKLKRGVVSRDIKLKGLSEFAKNFPKAILAESESELSKSIESMILSNYPLGVSAAAVAMATRTDTSKNLLNVKVPTLIIHGGKDQIISLDASKYLHEKIAGSSMCAFPNVAHAANLEDPKSFNKELQTFLKDNSL